VTWFHSSLWLNNTPLCIYTTFSLSIRWLFKTTMYLSCLSQGFTKQSMCVQRVKERDSRRYKQGQQWHETQLGTPSFVSSWATQSSPFQSLAPISYWLSAVN
jgi:hypothetical protein